MRKGSVILGVVLLCLIQSLLFAGCSPKADNDKQVKKTSVKDLKSSFTPSNKKVDTQKPDSTGAIDIGASKADNNNPIDKAFERDFKIASATVELNYVSEEYHKAWKYEWDNILSEIRKLYEYPEDKKAIDEYKRAFEEFVDKAYDVEWLSWSDTSEPPGKNRTWGTGAPSASNLEQAELYKRQVLYLIEGYYGTEFKDSYKFIYKGNGAQLEDKIRETEKSTN